MTRPYLDFYKKHNISPVSQDMKNHFQRRKDLYRSLGLLPEYFKNKRIIEFGPGNGHNAIYTSSLNPSEYTLVEANPKGLEETKKNLAGRFNCKVVKSLIEEYPNNKLFDIVICEGVIPYQDDSISFLKHIASFVDEGGVLIITCMDSVSSLSEILRQVIRMLMVNKDDPIEKQLDILRPILKPHLDTLENMSRPVDDWILDSIIQPLPETLMSMKEAILALDKEFDVYGSSPKMFTDWRWYKDIQGDYNEFALDLIDMNVNNLIDYRCVYYQSIEENKEIVRICNLIFGLLKNFKLDEIIILEQLWTLSRLIALHNTSLSIRDFIRVISQHEKITPQTDWGEFKHWWGRGQQYLSLTKRKE